MVPLKSLYKHDFMKSKSSVIFFSITLIEIICCFYQELLLSELPSNGDKIHVIWIRLLNHLFDLRLSGPKSDSLLNSA